MHISESGIRFHIKRDHLEQKASCYGDVSPNCASTLKDMDENGGKEEEDYEEEEEEEVDWMIDYEWRNKMLVSLSSSQECRYRRTND